ncbi:glycosyltransferase family 2 protein [Pandoraea sputorum]|uniref:Glycosyl transferase n=1 Tax=Pandoraea sputorum TaxID=93222 RepID=A0A5E5BHY6_9BURK|nr:glycosyltransferase family 2 protein [Pandoraea sputorum]VVE84722.1 glycosyl transferase [Pandoraea sputorum]
MRLSIVSTLYQSAAYIEEFCRRVGDVARSLVGDDYEIILVNDGSPDNSCAIAIALAQSDPHLLVVDLSRNFGHHKAMMTGLQQARGERVFLVDIDLEEEPEHLGALWAEMESAACDVVFGVQERRKGGRMEQLSGRWFYRLFKMLTGMALPEDVLTARLMTRRYVNALVLHDEREVFIAGLWHITGFSQRPLPLRKHSTSETTYTFRRKMSLLVNSVTSFSNLPLVGIFYCGLAISFVAVLYIAILFIQWAMLSRPLSGWTSVMASIWLLGGMIISFIGVVGIYLSKIYSETKRRPYTIIREIHGSRQ